MLSRRTWQHTLHIHDSALAATTRDNYRRALTRYKEWADAERVPKHMQLPIREQVVCAFAASFAGVYSAGAARSAIAGLKYYHEKKGWRWPSSARLSRILAAVRLHAPATSQRAPRPPVTLAMLDEALLHLDLNRGFDLCVATTMLVVFWGQMRLGEALPTTRAYDFSSMPAVKHAKLRADAGGDLSQETTAIWLPRTKTARTGDWVWLARHHNDPSYALHRHFRANRLAPNDPLFAYRHDRTDEVTPLTKRAFMARLNEIWVAAGMQRVSGHCFRIGSTTALLRAGVAPEVVKMAGRWRSDAFLRYWRSIDAIISQHADLCEVTWKGHDSEVPPF
ncbi:hypothetical protein AURDEDRAFT_176792 [Auricularia subglabra TFB-10046 SS5]|uniref:DNA breaking-rejoining enzyme n=1 Tax=Auricularia subglabra (strain TFB-10046 / SS5) TaxID=717982 RepID=J0LCC8_AURST|nr:hypothetical protein AURDEDRAFT_176792 [Auricularia subglabra TFB-10046 SS5]